MAMESVGLITFFILAILAASGATYHLVRNGGWKGVTVGYLAAGLFAGLGTFGPSFLDPYGRFIGALIEDPSPETYEDFLTRVGSGKVPEKAERAGLAIVLANPLKEMDAIYRTAVDRAKDPEGKDRIRGVKQIHETNVRMAEDFVKTSDFQALPAERKVEAIRPLISLDESRLRELRIDPELIRRLETSGRIKDSP